MVQPRNGCGQYVAFDVVSYAAIAVVIVVVADAATAAAVDAVAMHVAKYVEGDKKQSTSATHSPYLIGFICCALNFEVIYFMSKP